MKREVRCLVVEKSQSELINAATLFLVFFAALMLVLRMTAVMTMTTPEIDGRQLPRMKIPTIKIVPVIKVDAPSYSFFSARADSVDFMRVNHIESDANNADAESTGNFQRYIY